MSSFQAAESSDESAQIRLGRLLWAGPLTIAVSVAAVVGIRAVAVALLKPDSAFLPLTLETPVVDTVIASMCAVFVFRAMGRYSLEPVREFRALAWKVLVVSFVPDIVIAMQHWLGCSWPEAIALMFMHIAVWAICVTVLSTFAVSRKRLSNGSDVP